LLAFGGKFFYFIFLVTGHGQQALQLTTTTIASPTPVSGFCCQYIGIHFELILAPVFPF